jgi:hypothetical protein
LPPLFISAITLKLFEVSKVFPLIGVARLSGLESEELRLELFQPQVFTENSNSLFPPLFKILLSSAHPARHKIINKEKRSKGKKPLLKCILPLIRIILYILFSPREMRNFWIICQDFRSICIDINSFNLLCSNR